VRPGFVVGLSAATWLTASSAAKATAVAPMAGVCESATSAHCQNFPADDGCPPPVKLDLAQRWLAAWEASVTADETSVSDLEVALKLAEGKVTDTKPGDANKATKKVAGEKVTDTKPGDANKATKKVAGEKVTDTKPGDGATEATNAVVSAETNLKDAQDRAALRRLCLEKAKIYVNDLTVSLEKAQMLGRRVSVDGFVGKAAGSAGQIGATLGFGLAFSSFTEGEAYAQFRRANSMVLGQFEQPSSATLLGPGLRLLFGETDVRPYIGSGLATAWLDGDGHAWFVTPELGVLYLPKREGYCGYHGWLRPSGVGASIEPLIPVKGPGRLMVMFNLKLELDFGLNRLLPLKDLDSWFPGAARNNWGCQG
jgi:hypothetical protein